MQTCARLTSSTGASRDQADGKDDYRDDDAWHVYKDGAWLFEGHTADIQRDIALERTPDEDRY